MLSNISSPSLYPASLAQPTASYYAHDIAAFRHPRCYSILKMLQNNNIPISLRMVPTSVWLSEISSYMQVAQHRFISTLTPFDMTEQQRQTYLMGLRALGKKQDVTQAIYQRHKLETSISNRSIGGIWSNVMGHDMTFYASDDANTVPFLLADDVLIIERPCSARGARHYLYVVDHVDESTVLQFLRMSTMGLKTSLLEQFVINRS
jgi:hypothetical protein